MKNNIKKFLKKDIWLISDCTGEHLFIGSKKEAEEHRKHRARWEACIARKKHISKVKYIIIPDDSGTTYLEDYFKEG